MRVCLILLLLAAPLSAQRSYESAFGENTLAKCDLIVHAIAAAKRAKIGAAISVQLTLQEVLYGEEKSSEVTAIYTDASLLKEGESVEALFALKALAQNGFSLVGRPVTLASGDGEAKTKLAVCKAYIALERAEEGEARTKAFEDLLAADIEEGGYAGQNAAVELLLWVSRRPSLISKERYERFRRLLGAPNRALAERARKDVNLALQGMVEFSLKDDAFRSVRRGKSREERTEGGKRLEAYFKDHPRAFGNDDAVLAGILARDCQDGESATDRLSGLAEGIKQELKARKAEEEARRAKNDERVRHADGR